MESEKNGDHQRGRAGSHDDPTLSDELRQRYDRLTLRLRRVAEGAGHDPARLRVLAVTKAQPVAVVQAAAAAGITLLAENRVQEAEPKIAAVPQAEWHFIGRLQSNKVRRAVRSFAVVHSVDSAELMERVEAAAADEDRAPDVLLQVNVSGEASKAGFEPAALASFIAPRSVRLMGLMTIAPMRATDDEARAVFAGLRALRDRLEDRIGFELPELSMGMSADAEAAAAEGATLVRIGTALFGPRT